MTFTTFLLALLAGGFYKQHKCSNFFNKTGGREATAFKGWRLHNPHWAHSSLHWTKSNQLTSKGLYCQLQAKVNDWIWKKAWFWSWKRGMHKKIQSVQASILYISTSFWAFSVHYSFFPTFWYIFGWFFFVKLKKLKNVFIQNNNILTKNWLKGGAHILGGGGRGAHIFVTDFKNSVSRLAFHR